MLVQKCKYCAEDATGRYSRMLTYADRSSDFKFQEFARLTQEADSLQTRADALLSRADTIDGLIQSTQNDLGEKRKEFEHYKNRAQVTAASSKGSTAVCRDILDTSNRQSCTHTGHSRTDFLLLESTALYLGTCVVFLLRCRTDLERLEFF